MKKVSTGKRIIIFLLLTFALTYAFEIFVIGNMLHSPLAGLLISAVMFIPAIGVVLTRVITKEGFKDAWILPNFKGHIRFYIAAWLLPAALIVVGGVLYFLIYPDKFDPNMGNMAQQFAAVGLNLDTDTLRITLIGQILLGILISPVLNIFTTTGEEWGWRGYLVPKLSEKLSIIPTVFISGVIWGLWHAPLTVIIGHNYGFGYIGYPYMGILAMCVFCIAMGTLFSYVSLRTRSCLPAAIAHGSLNGLAASAIYFMPGADAANPFVGPMPTGIIGGVGFVIAMIVCILLMVRHQKRGTLIAPPKALKTAVSADAAEQEKIAAS